MDSCFPCLLSITHWCISKPCPLHVLRQSGLSPCQNHLRKLRHSKSQLPRAPKQSLIRSLNQIHSPSISMRSAASRFVTHTFHRYVARSMFVSPAHVITHLSDNYSSRPFPNPLLYLPTRYTFRRSLTLYKISAALPSTPIINIAASG